jgi:hypothetical protein
MAGKDERIILFPIYYPAHPNEPFFDQASRYLDVLLRSDVVLVEAAIQGWNRISPLAISIGMLISAVGLTIVETKSCLPEPALWLPHFAPLVRR